MVIIVAKMEMPCFVKNNPGIKLDLIAFPDERLWYVYFFVGYLM